MADMMSVAIAYLVLAALMISLLLFGESPMFRGTPVAWGHWLITEGFWTGAEWLLIRVCGHGARMQLERVLECCCDRPNPILQVSYVGLLIVGYWMYWTNLFALLPNKWVGDIHVVTGSVSLFVCCLTFVWACRSDPGIITEKTRDAHADMYPCDGAIWREKTCVTCHWARPARSKHCRVCGHCIARHDHHCGWINNCVGLLNHRIFLLFLVSNLVMTVYGGVLGVMILLGQADQAGMLRHKFLDYQTGGVRVIHLPASRVFEWLVVMAPLPVALTLFMTAAALLVTLFLTYQMLLITQGQTQYEVHRWRELHGALHREAQATQSDDNQPGSSSGPTRGSSGPDAMLGRGPGSGNSKADSSRASTSKAAGGRGSKAADSSSKAAASSKAKQRKGQQGKAAAGSEAGEESAKDHGTREGKGRAGGVFACCLLWLGRRMGWLPPRQQAGVVRLPGNMYNKGWVRNWSEVLFPYHHLTATDCDGSE